MQVVVESFTFAQELRGEDQVFNTQCLPCFGGVAHGYSGLDDHYRFRIDGYDVFDDRFDGPGIEIVGLRVVVGGGRDDDEVSAGVGISLVQRGTKVEGLVDQEVLDLFVFNRRFFLVQHRHLLGDDVQADNFVVLSKQDAVGETHVASTGDRDLHRLAFPRPLASSSPTSALSASISTFNASYSSILRLRNRLVSATFSAMPWGVSR